MVDTLDKHRCVVFGWCGQDDFLSSTVNVAHSGLMGEEHACTLTYNVSIQTSPLDGCRCLFIEYFDGFATNSD